jgi:ribosomal protein S18 acetylase RimI-like enzyme
MVSIHIHKGGRSALLPLFALADDSPFHVSRYMELGVLLVARDGDEVVGHAQIIKTPSAAVFELKSIAVCRHRQRTGIGRDLVRAAIRHCQQRNGRRLIVSTAAADTGNLRFYQRQGFRLYQIVRDVFVPSNGYAEGIVIDGIPLRDQVSLELNLTELPGSSVVGNAIPPPRGNPQYQL